MLRHIDGGVLDFVPTGAIPQESELPTIVINPFWAFTTWQYFKRGFVPSTVDLEDSIIRGARHMAELLRTQAEEVKGVRIIMKRTLCAGGGQGQAWKFGSN